MKNLKSILLEKKVNYSDIKNENTISITQLINQINNIKDLDDIDYKKIKIVFRDVDENLYPITNINVSTLEENNTQLLEFTSDIK